jgi:2-amino-4-hydroxy-6-hydroxymethyldihydropteridine diphosphokinase
MFILKSAYLHLGSNIGNKKSQLESAIESIKKSIGKVVTSSSFYETEAWGKKDQESFLNIAIEVLTDLSAEDLLKQCNKIEAQVKSVKAEKWGPRILDIDILFLGDKVVKNSTLTIPHPEIENRNFVLIPLMEIAGEFIHPVLNKTIEELYEECKDECEVFIFE